MHFKYCKYKWNGAISLLLIDLIEMGLTHVSYPYLAVFDLQSKAFNGISDCNF